MQGPTEASLRVWPVRLDGPPTSTAPAARRRPPAGSRLWCRAGVVAGAVLAADQTTKAIAHHLPVQARGWFQPVENPDLALSLHPVGFAVTVLIVGVLVAFSAHLWHLTRRRILPGWVAGLLVGGAVSNLGDRLLLAAVRDWVALPWVVVNLADLAVAAGAVAYLVAGARWAVAGWPGLPAPRPAS